MSNERRAMRWRVRFLVATTFAAASATIAVACGSDVPSDPPLCEGAACIDAGVDAPTPHDGASDTDAGSPDAFADAKLDAGETGADAPDGSSCRYAEAGTDGGALNSAQRFGTTGHTTPAAVALDPTNDDVIVVGSFFGQIDFGGGALVSAGATDGTTGDVFVAKRSKTGSHVWAKNFGSGILAVPSSVAVGASRHVVVGGAFFEGAVLDFGCGPMTAVGALDAFVVDFDASGACVWSKRFGVPGEVQNLLSASVDTAGDVVIGGVARGGANFDGPPLSGPFVVKFNSAGVHLWSRTIQASSTAGSPVHASGPQGEVFLAGTLSGAADLGDGPITSSGASEAFLVKFDSRGQRRWSRRYPAVPSIPGANAGASISQRSLAVDSCGNAYIAGAFGAQTGAASMEFGGGTLTAAGGDTYRFLAKVDGSGTSGWARMFTGTSSATSPDVFFGGLAITEAGGPVIAARLGGDVASGAQTTMNFGGGPLQNASKSSLAVAVFDRTGAHRWSYIAGSPSTARSTVGGIAVSGQNLVIAFPFGRCTSTCTTSPLNANVTFAGATLTAASGQDIAIATMAP